MPCTQFNQQMLHSRRIAYAYPAVALGGVLGAFTVLDFPSTIAQDNHINSLLHSQTIEDKVLGYLAVLFWGHYSGQDGRNRQPRALGKVNLSYQGLDRVVKGRGQRIRGVLDIGVQEIAANICLAIIEIENDQYSNALRYLRNLPGIQIAFASKICAFIDPQKCGVIDSIIAERHPEFGFTTRNGYVVDDVANRTRYNAYCQCLQSNSAALNASTQYPQWTDRDDSQHVWRALDVERALY